MAAECTGCGAALAANARFCPDCGTPRPVSACPACGAQLSRGRFCAECGSPVAAARQTPPPRVSERRVTSVLFGDLVGFTTLSETRDAEDVRELLSRYFNLARTVVGRYGGTIEKFIGDAVMAVWGVPAANEDDAERAVRAGLDLVAAVGALGEEVGAPGLAMRVGIVTGEVAVTVGATAEGMVAGDAVNTAARIQAAAEPGSVWVDDATRALTSAAVEYADAGLHELKGKATAMRLFRAQVVVAAVGGAQRIDGLEAPFTGRDRHLRLVKELFHETAEEGRPRLVLVSGAAGVGKSRLAWEFEKYVDGLSDSWAWHRGRCLSYGDGVAFWALAEVVRGRLGLTEADPASAVQERLAEGLPRLLPDPQERGWVVPRLARLLGIGDGHVFAREDLFAAWTRFLERAGAGLPVVVVLDDVQHADDGLLDFLDHLLATATSAVYILGLARPELLERRPALSSHRRVTVLHLEPLGAPAMAALVDGLVEGLTGTVRQALVERAEGIPLYAVETVRALIDRDLVVPQAGRYVLAPGAPLDLERVGAPASLHALVASRLDALPAAERRLLASASVLGQSFPLSALAALCDEQHLDELVASLLRREFLAVQADRLAADRGQLRFVQAVVRQVAYDTLSRRDRRAGHLAAAAHLQDEPNADDLAGLIAQHYLDAVAASSPADPEADALAARAVALLEAAAARALGLGAAAEALRHLTIALTNATEEPTRLALHEQAARAAEVAGDYAACVEHAQQVLTGLGDADVVRSAGCAVVAARALLDAGRLHEASDLLVSHLRRLPDVAATQFVTLDALSLLRRAYNWSGDAGRAEETGERQRRLAERLGDPVRLAEALTSTGTAMCNGGQPVTGAALLRQAVELARHADAPRELTRALINTYAATYARDFATALACIREAVQVSQRAGASERMFAEVNLAAGLHLSGQWTPAAELLDVTGADGGSFVAGQEVLAVLRAWQQRARTGAAPDLLPQQESDNLAAMAWLRQLETVAAERRGDLAGAAAAAAAGLDAGLQANGLQDDFPHLWPPAVLASVQAGLLDQAERQIAVVADAPAGLVTPLLRAQLLRLQGVLAAARGEDPEELLMAGIDALTEFGALPDCARTQHALAAWLVRQGRSEDAQPLLADARRTYQSLGAAVWLEELEAVAASAPA